MIFFVSFCDTMCVTKRDTFSDHFNHQARACHLFTHYDIFYEICCGVCTHATESITRLCSNSSSNTRETSAFYLLFTYHTRM